MNQCNSQFNSSDVIPLYRNCHDKQVRLKIIRVKVVKIVVSIDPNTNRNGQRVTGTFTLSASD